jgi:hypothetical protein
MAALARGTWTMVNGPVPADLVSPEELKKLRRHSEDLEKSQDPLLKQGGER